MKTRLGIVIAAVSLLLAGNALAELSTLNDFKLAADFKPTAEELKAARFLGVAPSRGCEFEAPGGWRPIYVTQLPTGTLVGDPLQAGDVIVAVGGKPLVKNSVDQVRDAMAAARSGTQLVEITRWRAGKVEPVTIDLRVRPPDLTAGEKPDENHDWTLGPTGMRGWIYTRDAQSEFARQILVTKVAKDSPADGILEKGDVILGVGGKPFDGNARIQLAQAITGAEKKTGSLQLVRWRAGKTEDVTLKLPVLGTYSATAPYDCAKSAKILEAGCQAIARRGLKGVSIPNSLNALALLASGNAEYRPLLADYAKQVAEFKAESMATWSYGYANTFLAEYVIATGDKSVLPGVQRLALEAARGQSGVGTWGHKFARPDGNLNGYGCMNQPGLTLMISMVLAREAGVKDPVLDRAITKGASFLRWYAGKGAIPYGDHPPFPAHEDNGKCSSASVLFDLLGDKETATFFAKMSTAAYDERERGHTGNFFNVLWAVLGVSRGGPLATGAYLQEQAWYYDLARGWDGSFDYQGSPVGAEEHGKYKNWDSTGAYLLTYALPLKSLHITGKKPSVVPAWKRAEVAEVIAAGRDFYTVAGKNQYDKRSTEALLAGLSSWSTAVRKRSAEALARREGDFVPALLKLLAGKDQTTRYGAVEALGALGAKADSAAPQIRALLKESDPWLQSLACLALANLGPEAQKASVNDLLAVAATPNPADARGMLQRNAGNALFAKSRRTKGVLSESLADVDRGLLYPAIRAVLKNEDGAARGAAGNAFANLSERDLAVLLPDIIPVIEKLAPSGEMFADGVRLAGLNLLSKHHIREGMALCVAVMEPDRWGQGHRVEKCTEYLLRYGTHAKEVLPQLEQYRRRPSKTKDETFDKLIASIEPATNAPTLVTLKDFQNQERGKQQ